MAHKIEALRDHLFAELADLRDPDKKYDKERTHAVVEVAQTIINSAKAETDFLNLIGGGKSGTGFLLAAGAGEAKPAAAPSSGGKLDPPALSAGWMDKP